MRWQPELLTRNADTPLHEQLAQHIRAAVADGRLRAGDVLPPEPLLAETLGVARGTAARAIQRLVLEGVLIRRRGRGTTVLPRADRSPAGSRATIEPAATQAVRLAQLQAIEQELNARLQRLEALQERLAGELFLLRRQREWNRALRERNARRRATPFNSAESIPRRRRKRS